MKRYEKMSVKEILSVLESASRCSSCRVDKDFCMKNRIKNDIHIGCSAIVSNWLNEEIKPKLMHRYELIKSSADLEKFRIEFEDHCTKSSDCRACKHYGKGLRMESCFCAFLNEEIEVEE